MPTSYEVDQAIESGETSADLMHFFANGEKDQIELSPLGARLNSLSYVAFKVENRIKLHARNVYYPTPVFVESTGVIDVSLGNRHSISDRLLNNPVVISFTGVDVTPKQVKLLILFSNVQTFIIWPENVYFHAGPRDERSRSSYQYKERNYEVDKPAPEHPIEVGSVHGFELTTLDAGVTWIGRSVAYLKGTPIDGLRQESLSVQQKIDQRREV